MGSTLRTEDCCEDGVGMELGWGLCCSVIGCSPDPADCCGDNTEAVIGLGGLCSSVGSGPVETALICGVMPGTVLLLYASTKFSRSWSVYDAHKFLAASRSQFFSRPRCSMRLGQMWRVAIGKPETLVTTSPAWCPVLCSSAAARRGEINIGAVSAGNEASAASFPSADSLKCRAVCCGLGS